MALETRLAMMKICTHEPEDVELPYPSTNLSRLLHTCLYARWWFASTSNVRSTVSVEALIRTGLYLRHEYNSPLVGGKLRQRIYINLLLVS
jgi:hypothetical protein